MLSELMEHLHSTTAFLAVYWLLTCVHETFHILAACVVGHFFSALTTSNLISAACSRHVHVPGVSGWRADVIQHAGWIGSVVVALCLNLGECETFVQAAAWLTALDAMCSDLLGMTASSCKDVFYCGNFGLVILNKEHRDKVLKILQEMVRITSKAQFKVAK